MDTNQGEGNRDAAKAYDKDTQEFIKSGKVGPAAEDAKKVSGAEKAELEKAEAIGKSHSHGEDPSVKN